MVSGIAEPTQEQNEKGEDKMSHNEKDSEEILENIEIIVDVTFDGEPPKVYIFTKWTDPLRGDK